MKGGSQEALIKSKRAFSVLAFFAFFVLPLLYGAGFLSIGDVNMLGRYMTFAILALGLDLLWGYVGILSLCQFTFFCLGAYAMGMHLAHHGDRGNHRCRGLEDSRLSFRRLSLRGRGSVRGCSGPGFWKPFWNLPLTVLLGLAIPGLVSFALGYLVFRSRVRGVYFAILTQAIAVASWLVFCRNDESFGGTNGLTRFDVIAPKESITTFNPVDAKDQWLASHGNSMEYDLNKDGKLDQLDYSVAEVGFSLSSAEVQLALYFITAICLFGAYLLCRWIVNSGLERFSWLFATTSPPSIFSDTNRMFSKFSLFALLPCLRGLRGCSSCPR